MRKILRPGASIIGVALLALASVNFEELFKSLGWNQLFIDSRGPVMDWLASPASSPWLFFASGVF